MIDTWISYTWIDRLTLPYIHNKTGNTH